jgi:phage shock protein A
MVFPLSDTDDAALNSETASSTPFVTPRSSVRDMDYQVTTYTETIRSADSDGRPSSPFVSEIAEVEDRENISPSKLSRQSKSPVDRQRFSLLAMLKTRTSPEHEHEIPEKRSEPGRSSRKLSSPEKRFPVKPSTSPEKRSAVVERSAERTVSLEVALRDNEGLSKAIEILEDEDSDAPEEHISDEAPYMDDTMVSTFSAFSAAPDMTMFAKLGHSPTKFAGMGPTPRRTQMNTPATSRRPGNRSPSPTPRAQKYSTGRDDGNTTNLILDFTDQISGFSGRLQSAAEQGRQSIMKSSGMPDMYGTITPSVNRRMSNLLDFDIPPAPTPRSMPSITARELESLKSNFLSEISSLKASLSGREAEVQSLKTAVGDAEKRVGESMEQVREEKNLKEQLAAEKEGWEKRGREMEAVLRNVKEEIVHGERERDDLEGRLEESERRREAAEIMAQEAESKMAAMRAGKISPAPEANQNKSGECSCGGRPVEMAVEKVSRELHALYKGKHETKVAALKKSYERRWEKKVKELEGKIEEISKENEELKLGRDTTMTKVEPKNPLGVTEDLEKQAARDAKTKELEAELEGLSEVVKSVKKDNTELRELLDEERVEKSKLVQAVDEMIPLVAAFDDMLAGMNAAPAEKSANTPRAQNQAHAIENLRGSISRASGLRAPTSISSIAPGESRIGRGGFGVPAASGHDRSGSAHGGRPGSGMGYRSGLMSSIEKMGNYRGRGE